MATNNNSSIALLSDFADKHNNHNETPSNLKRKRDPEVRYEVFSQLNAIIERKVLRLKKNKQCVTCDTIGHSNANYYRCEFNKANLAKRRKNVSI